MNIHNFINRPMTTDLVSRLILSKTHNQEIYLSICGSYVAQIHNKTIPITSQILTYPVNIMRKKNMNSVSGRLLSNLTGFGFIITMN